jgi:hypothetical protein
VKSSNLSHRILDSIKTELKKLSADSDRFAIQLSHINYYRALLKGFDRNQAVFTAPGLLYKYWEQGKLELMARTSRQVRGQVESLDSRIYKMAVNRVELVFKDLRYKMLTKLVTELSQPSCLLQNMRVLVDLYSDFQ